MNTLLKEMIGSPELLRQGDTILLKALSEPQNRKSLLETLYLNENRYYIPLIKNIYPTIWQTLSQQQKQYSRETLLKIFHQKYNQVKDIQMFGLLINKLHNLQGFEVWKNMYQQLIQLGLTQQVLQYFLIIYRTNDDRISIINQSLIQQLAKSIQNPDNTPLITQKLIILLYYIIKTSSSFQGVNDQLFHSIIGSRTQWLYNIYSTILNSKEIHLHKLVIQQLTLLFSNSPKYAFKSFSNLINYIWNYFNNLVPVYLNQNVINQYQANTKSIADQYIFGSRFQQQVTTSEALIYQLLQLIQTIFLHKSMKKIMKFAVYPLLSAMYSLLLITKINQRQWIEQQNKFIADLDDENILGVRSRVISFINILIQNRYKNVIDIIKLIINNSLYNKNNNLISLQPIFKQDIASKNIMADLNEKILSQSKELEQIFQKSFINIEINSNLIKQSAIFLLFSFPQSILSNLPDNNKNSIIEQLRVEIEQSDYPLLRIQSLNTLIKCVENINIQQIPQFITYTMNCINTDIKGLQIISIKAIGVFFRKLRMSTAIDHSHIKIQQYNIQRIINLISIFTKQTIHVLIDTLIELIKFSNDIKLCVIQSLQPLISNLLDLGLSDGLIQSQLIELFGDSTSAKIQQFFLMRLEQALNTKGSEEIIQFLTRILQINLENNIFTYNNLQQINIFICKYVNNEYLQSLIRQFIRYFNISQQTMIKCVQNIKRSWFIPLHQKGININVLPLLKQSVQSIIQLLSPSEVEQQLTLPFYLMWNNYQETMNAIKSFGLYDQFITKWLRYQETFKGIILKKASLILSSKLTEQKYVNQINQYISREKNTFLKQKEIISKMQPEWEDEEEEGDEEQGDDYGGLGIGIDDDGWLEEDLVNKIAEKMLINSIKGIEDISIEDIISTRTS